MGPIVVILNLKENLTSERVQAAADLLACVVVCTLLVHVYVDVYACACVSVFVGISICLSVSIYVAISVPYTDFLYVTCTMVNSTKTFHSHP